MVSHGDREIHQGDRMGSPGAQSYACGGSGFGEGAGKGKSLASVLQQVDPTQTGEP